ncbi:unnamed protein product [Eruca vesicaria subsp. sativa]|uniref:Uncharacterized protein n=1 Tax=Eruca vesicaria subsp. sativa TaxID=29727 RepID=A0ABC8J086_ERUVS|nr:unnamed protein product [Eruca vesicaria subsp. sativa]
MDISEKHSRRITHDPRKPKSTNGSLGENMTETKKRTFEGPIDEVQIRQRYQQPCHPIVHSPNKISTASEYRRDRQHEAKQRSDLDQIKRLMTKSEEPCLRIPPPTQRRASNRSKPKTIQSELEISMQH